MTHPIFIKSEENKGINMAKELYTVFTTFYPSIYPYLYLSMVLSRLGGTGNENYNKLSRMFLAYLGKENVRKIVMYC